MRKIVTLLSLLCLVSCGNRKNPVQEEPDYDSIANAIMKNLDADDAASLESPSDEKTNLDPLIGSYRCTRTKDAYVFYSDGTGTFFTGDTNTDFTWKRTGEKVILTYEVFGKQVLTFNPKAKTLTENSESLDKLVFNEE